MTLIQRVTRVGSSPEITRPDAAKLVSGDPVHTTWNLEDTNGLYAGLWQSTPGKWRVSYSEWEYFRILSGYSILTGADGSLTQLHPGDSMIIRPGFQGEWEVVETTLKDYVIRT
ncbi:MAG: cupin [Rhodobacter sp.]|nr:cupin [Rhodobacter sp.]